MLPYQRFSLATTGAPAEVVSRLKAGVAASSFFDRAATASPFQGWVRGNSFLIMRVFEQRNSFVPVVRGRVVEASDGSKVEGTMGFHYSTLVFMTLWSGLLLVMMSALLRDAASLRWSALLALLAMQLGFWTLAIVVSTSEAKKVRHHLLQVLGSTDSAAVA